MAHVAFIFLCYKGKKNFPGIPAESSQCLFVISQSWFVPTCKSCYIFKDFVHQLLNIGGLVSARVEAFESWRLFMLHITLGLSFLFLRTVSPTKPGCREARNRNCLLSALPSLTNRSSVYKEKVNGFFFFKLYFVRAYVVKNPSVHVVSFSLLPKT